MILTKPEIIKLIKEKKIIIKPFNKNQIGPASIDLTLDNKFRIFKNHKELKIKENTDYKKITKLVKTNEFILKHDETVLGISKEKIKLPENICGWLSGRSRFARFGLIVHFTAPFVQPGINNKQVLEIRNIGPLTLKLKPGTKICQLILEEAKGKAKYKGKFKNQKL